MPSKNTICLWYDGTALDAATFYATTFPDSAVGAVHRAPGDYPEGKQGDILTVEFTVMCATWRAMMPLVLRTIPGSEPASANRSAAALIGASGLRNSWASIARNSSLRRLPARNSSLARTAAVTSLPSMNTPVTWPLAFLIGWNT